MVQHSPSLSVGQLVCVTQYYPPVNGVPQIGPALAVGYMTLSGDQVGGTGKGKAVNIVHIWKDNLWEKGGKGDPPAQRVVELNQPDIDGESPASGEPDPAIETASEGPLGVGSSQIQDKPPLVTPPKEEHNPLSQQGISPLSVATIS